MQLQLRSKKFLCADDIGWIELDSGTFPSSSLLLAYGVEVDSIKALPPPYAGFFHFFQFPLDLITWIREPTEAFVWFTFTYMHMGEQNRADKYKNRKYMYWICVKDIVRKLVFV